MSEEAELLALLNKAEDELAKVKAQRDRLIDVSLRIAENGYTKSNEVCLRNLISEIKSTERSE